MIIINEIPDYNEDRRGGKWTLVARYGQKNGIRLYAIGLSVAYLLIIASVIFNLASPYFLLALITAPMALRSLKIARLNYSHPQRLIPANRSMIYIHAITLIMMIMSHIPGIAAYWIRHDM
jgi:1,4-dihydroxy-2-naphthoate octaprenyltransferase